jgi:MSHA biogenesis protein MshJ
MAGNRTSPALWYNQRPLRERRVLLLCALVVLLFVGYSLILQPLLQRRDNAQQKITRLETEMQGLRAQQQLLLARKDVDPDRENRQRLEVLQQQTAQLQHRLEGGIASLVAPAEMPELLKKMLTREPRLSLVEMENLAPEPLEFATSGKPEEGALVLYRHPLKLTFSGDYLALLRYLRQLEELPRKLVWEEVAIETAKYPQSRVHLQVSTLSLEEGWIGG